MSPLTRATEQQKIAIDRATHEAWGATLTPAQFLERERRLRATAWCGEAMRTWVWTGEQNEILSSCETFQMPSRLAGSDGRTYGIASVFTPAAHRGQGLASKLLTDVMAAIIAEDPSTHAFILSSEVGTKIYERLGFELCPSGERAFRAEADRTKRPTDLREGALYGEYAKWKWQDGREFEIRPSGEQMAWHVTRERIYAELLKRPRPRAQGAVLPGALTGWVADFKSNCLRILFLFAKTPAEAEGLIRCAQQSALEAGLAEVRVWETEAFTDWNAVAIPNTRRERDDGLAMIRPVASGANARAWRPISRATWV